MKHWIPSSILTSVLLPWCMLLQPDVAAVRPPQQVEISASRYSYQPASVTLKRGEPVVLVLHAQDVAHGLRFSELNIDLKAPKHGTAQAAFTPTRAGDFTGHCSVFCGTGHGSMTIALHVEP